MNVLYFQELYLLVDSCCVSLYSWLIFFVFIYYLLQSVKGAKAPKVAAAAAGDGQPVTKQGEEKSKMHTHSYCCLDYAQVSYLQLSALRIYLLRR
jgi:hypothetical protein